MKQQLRYGLTTAFRPFETPTIWNGTLTTNVEGVGRGKTGTHTISIPALAEGVCTVTRILEGDVKEAHTVHVGAGANVTIIDTITGSGSLDLTVNVVVERDANVTYAILHDLERDAAASANIRYEANVSAAQLRWDVCALGSETTRLVIRTHAHERADVKTRVAIVGTARQQFDVETATIHEGAHSASDMLVRAALDGESRVLSRGLIRIEPQSNECDSYQKSELLLLSPNAGADAIPNLEIHNNNVRCTHGATIGAIDDEELFYVRSRGIDDETAKRLITEGFISDIVRDAWLTTALERLGFRGVEDDV